ncbi:hypothetical protein GCK32_010343, partial [Trichostrongylus colubriformis]
DDDRIDPNDRSSTDFSLSTLTVNYSDGPPSPDSSRSKIFHTLCSNSELGDKLALSKQFPLSPSATGFTAITRVTDYWHHPSDVAGGILLAASCVLPVFGWRWRTHEDVYGPRQLEKQRPHSE